jgi:hypothetical protein
VSVDEEITVSVLELSPHAFGHDVLGRAERVAHHAVELAERAADALPSVSMSSLPSLSSLPSVSMPSLPSLPSLPSVTMPSLPSVSLPSLALASRLPHRPTTHSRWRWVIGAGVVAAVLLAVMAWRRRAEDDMPAT